MTNPTQRIILGLNNETLVYLWPGQRQILFEKVEVLDHKIDGLFTADLQQIRRRHEYIGQSALAALADHFPNLIEELHQQEIADGRATQEG
jgi:hypothetical protein